MWEKCGDSVEKTGINESSHNLIKLYAQTFCVQPFGPISHNGIKYSNSSNELKFNQKLKWWIFPGKTSDTSDLQFHKEKVAKISIVLGSEA